MGYYTQHDLEMIDNPVDGVDHRAEICAISGYSDPFGEECKWYEMTAQMIEYSKNYPQSTFVISGEGEESGDIWKAYFKNGMRFEAKAELVFEEYDESKLTPIN